MKQNDLAIAEEPSRVDAVESPDSTRPAITPKKRHTTDDSVARLQFNALARIYSENAQNFRHFLEWRHRILLRYFVLMAAAILSLKGVVDHLNRLSPWLLLIPSFIAMVGSLVSFGLDRRNTAINGIALDVGSEVERKLSEVSQLSGTIASGGAFFTRLRRDRRAEFFSYSNILRVLYLGTFGIALVTGLLTTHALFRGAGQRLASEFAGFHREAEKGP